MVTPTDLSNLAASPSNPRARNLAEYVRGRQLPPVVLESFLTGKETLLEVVVARGPSAVYFYPGSTSEAVSRWSKEDAAQHCGFRDRQEDLASHGVRVVGISGEPRSLQGRVYLDLGIEHHLLSDPMLSVAEELGLPTLCIGGQRFYARLTLLIGSGGVIEHAFDSPSEPGRDAARVCTWLRAQRGLS